MIIGGYFGLNPWQRGTSFAAVADGAYTADRFIYNKVGTMVHTIQKSTDVPVYTFPYKPSVVSTSSLLIDCTTADAAIAAADLCTISYKMEGYDYCFYAQQGFKVTFYVKATKTGIYCFSIRNSGSDRSFVSEYTISVANTWQKKTIFIDASPTAGTWDYTNGVGMVLTWTLAAGSNFQTTADAWQAGNFLATSNQVNACDNILNNFQLESIKIGFWDATDALPAIDAKQTFQDVLHLCQRYYQKSYNTGVAPGTATAVGAITHVNALANTFSGSDRLLPAQMRDTPTMAWYSTTTGTVANIRNTTGAADVATTGTASAGMGSTGVPTVAAIAADQETAFHWTANAEL